MTAESQSTVRQLRPRPPLPTKTDEEFERAPENRPRGIGTAILFDWSFVAFLVALVVMAAAQRGIASRQAAAAALLAIVLGTPLALLGEALRRGKRPARIIQITASGLIGALNLLGFIRDLSSLLQGTLRFPLNLVALIAGIAIIWGLTRPQTIAWFARVKSSQARARHGSRWLALALLASLVIGVIWCFGTLQ